LETNIQRDQTVFVCSWYVGNESKCQKRKWYKEILIFAYALREFEILFVFCVSVNMKSK